MSVAGVNSTTATYAAYESRAAVNSKPAAEEAKKNTAAEEGAVYEGSSKNSSNKASYSANKMSSSERAALVKQLKADQASRQSQLVDIVKQMMTKQANKTAQANDDIWKFLAKGDFTVDPKTKAQAQADIAEDGYYGVKQTSERIFDFAKALAGDDPEKMKDMQAAFEKGFKQATKSWGRDLPDISSQTRDSVNQMFDDYYKSLNVIRE